MKTSILTILLMVVMAGMAKAQKKRQMADTTLAKSWYEQAISLQKKGKYDSSDVFFDKSASVYKKYQLWEQYLDCQIKVSLNLNSLGKYDEAFQKANEVVAESQVKLGADHPKEADAYHTIALIYNYKGNADKSIELHHKALDIRRKAYGEEHASVGDSYYSIGNVYIVKGEFDKALEYIHKDLLINRKLLGDTHLKIGGSYHSLSSIYEAKNEYEQALEYSQKAVQIFLKTFGENHPNVATSYQLLGRIYNALGDYEKAIRYFQHCLQIRLKFVSESHPSIADTYIRMGVIHFRNKDYDTALEYYTKALLNRRKAMGDLHPQVAEPYNFVGDAYLEKAEYQQALSAYQHAIMANIPSFQDTIPSHNPAISQPSNLYLDGKILLTSLQLKAETWKRKYLQSQQVEDLKMASQTYFVADTLLRQLQQNLSSENDKLMMAERARKIFSSSLQVSLNLYENTSEDRYKHQAFYFAERSKASVLSASMAEAKAKTFAGITESLLSEYDRLQKDENEYVQQIAKVITSGITIDSSKLNDYQNKLFTTRRIQENLIKKLEKEYPNYYQLKYQPATVTVRQLQQILDKETALVEYTVSDTVLQIMTITSQSFAVQSVRIDSLFHRQLTAFKQSILMQDDELYQQVAYALHRILLPEVFPKTIRSLLIIPEGELTVLPFEALPAQPKPGKLKLYLNNNYAISYAYSAGLLYNRLTQPKETGTKSLLAVAPVFADSLTNVTASANRKILTRHQPAQVDATSPSTQNVSIVSKNEIEAGTAQALRGWLLNGQYISPLLASEREAKNIVALFRKNSGTTKLLLHAQATEEQLTKSDISSYNYLHLATHGFVNESYPELSGLLFAQDSTSKEDGILYTGEVYNLRLNADLVTLSACETGLGKIVRGEGVIGLSRALLYAGSRNIVVSFWKVPDESTADLMEYFYTALLNGKDKATALQEAKRSMMLQKKYAHPFYWAPFVLIGK